MQLHLVTGKRLESLPGEILIASHVNRQNKAKNAMQNYNKFAHFIQQ